MMARAMVFGACRIILQLFIRLAIIATIIVLGLYWGKLFEALLTLVAILQFELAYRQYWLSRVRDEPTFAVYALREHSKNEILLKVKNIGLTPAYIVVVSRILCKGKPLPPDLWSGDVKNQHISCLEPSSETASTLAVINEGFFEEYFNKRRCVIEVSYFNIYGEWHTFSVVFHNYTPIVVQYVKKPPGFLLSIPDYILMIKAMIEAYVAIRIIFDVLSKDTTNSR